MKRYLKFLLLTLPFAVLCLTTSCKDNEKAQNEICCTTDCSKECKEMCLANDHACAKDANDKSCCTDANGNKKAVCCDGKMEGKKSCCSEKKEG